MNIVQVSIDEAHREFVISGEIQGITKNYRAKYHFLDVLKASFHSDNRITIPYEDKERELVLKKVQKSLAKHGIEQVDSPAIKEVLNDYYTEQENFKTFSQKAKNIWRNEVDVQEFRAFKESLENNMPNRRLYDKQLLAAFHLAFSQNACNFSVPGAGKTSVVYGAYTYLNNLPKEHPKHLNKIVIIGPLSSFGPWELEYEECFGTKLISKRLSGGVSPAERDSYLLSVMPVEEVPEVTLMSYQSVPNNLDNLRHFLQRQDLRVMLVLDEAHKIKNIEGGTWASSVLKIAKFCTSRVVLTGTPMPNGYEDIYNLYEFIWPDKDLIDFNVFQLKDMSAKPFDPRIGQLIDSISPFFIRIRKSDLNLPPANERPPIRVEMGQIQREIYDFIENKYIGFFEGSTGGSSAFTELAKARLIRLMQAASNPGLLKKPLEQFFAQKEGLSSELYLDDSAIVKKILHYKQLENVPKKFEVIKDLVSDLLDRNEKVIIWGTFIQSIKELQDYLALHGIMAERLIGETPIEMDEVAEDILTRERIIREFHDPQSSFKVIIANPFAVAESISLHKACHNAIYFELTFNASNYMQSKDRIHRYGLPPETITNYYYVQSANSVDETILTRLREKEKRMLELIESQEIPLISENLNYEQDLKDDIKAIIRDYVRRTAKI